MIIRDLYNSERWLYRSFYRAAIAFPPHIVDAWKRINQWPVRWEQCSAMAQVVYRAASRGGDPLRVGQSQLAGAAGAAHIRAGRIDGWKRTTRMNPRRLP